MKHPSTETSARISEIFSSIQGEGTHLGERHLFVRFEECHMHCAYCDELSKPAEPLSIDQVISKIHALESSEGPHSFVSLTGGEPLLYLPYLKPLIAVLKEKGFRVYLETSGVLWHALQEIVGQVDCISMDMKAASVTGEKNYDSEHVEFLKIARQKEMFVKMVISKEILIAEFEAQVKIMQDQDPSIPLLLMPISPTKELPLDGIEGHEDKDLMRLMVELQQLARKSLKDVRIVPRLHKILNVR